jgi:adenylate kinase
MRRYKKIGIIIFGPPGSGKGTQAKLLADKFDFFHFDTGGYLRKLLYDPKLQKNKIIQREKKLNETGKLNTELWVTKIVSGRFEELIKSGQSIVTEGFPRTLFEAFGDNKTEGAINIFEKGYGKNNIFIFLLDIPERESIKRITRRFICSVCKALLLSPKFQAKGFKFKICPFCGGKIVHRLDDNRETIITRLKEYKQRTQPIFREFKKRKYRVYKINGTPMPYKIHQKAVSYLTK